MKTVILFFCLLFSTLSFASDKEPKVFLTLGSDALISTEKMFGDRLEVIGTEEGISLIEIDSQALPWLSMKMHQEFKRCGGYMLHENKEQANKHLKASLLRESAKEGHFTFYEIDQEEEVKKGLELIEELKIRETISHLSNYHNRYYQSETGVEAARWIKEKWQALTSHRNDTKVELYQHQEWDQPSVILTIEGKSTETLVVGGHLDSIAGFFGSGYKRAPGADDNASGIATITEVIRVLMANNYVPEKTLKFMGYAAEEVGLRGSGEIAREMKEANAQVVGVLQLDMTNFNGSSLDIVLVNDYTNAQQNRFVGSLIDTYLPGLRWGYDRCGYACSDHASWHTQGFPASMPFEAKKNDMNSQIHTARDTLDVSRGSASHATKFAKLAYAYVVELDR